MPKYNVAVFIKHTASIPEDPVTHIYSQQYFFALLFDIAPSNSLFDDLIETDV